jgi:hypothetical protein
MLTLDRPLTVPTCRIASQPGTMRVRAGLRLSAELQRCVARMNAQLA